ncbi:LysR family transcriptional regulator [Sneathiella limimaris]|uniref:LysR family transcriptional regulator n=1 Tax=Sneathiella limimaris TaxID=1964213 RepID=UPI00146AA9BD|nr:LysR family transcriptional regulator [Sneathiella limimaris]
MANLTDMAAFVAVVEQGSFSQAGRELRVSTAVVSARVAKLEKDLGVRLLNRTTRQVAPTEEAIQYYEDCKKILAEVAVAEASLSSRQQSPSGSLKLSAPTVFGRRYIAPLLAQFQSDYPDLQVQLQLSDSFVDPVKDGYDLIIRIARLPDSSLVARKLGDSPRILCAAPAYLEKARLPKSPEELMKHNCLLLRFPGSTQFQWEFVNQKGDRQTVPVKGSLDSNNGDVIREWALAGYGICLKSRWEVEAELADGRLMEIDLAGLTPSPVDIYALYPVGNINPPKVRLLLDYLVGVFARGLPQ